MEEFTSQPKKTLRILAVGASVVVIIGLAGIFFWQKIQDNKDVVNFGDVGEGELDVSGSTQVVSEEELQKNFTQSLEVLLQDLIKKEGDAHELIGYVEERMFAIRVPKNKKDQYMEIFLAIEKIKQETTQSPEEIKAVIITHLNSLK